MSSTKKAKKIYISKGGGKTVWTSTNGPDAMSDVVGSVIDSPNAHSNFFLPTSYTLQCLNNHLGYKTGIRTG